MTGDIIQRPAPPRVMTGDIVQRPAPPRVMTGDIVQTPPPAPEFIEAESPKRSFRARLSAKFKSMLEWMWERLFFFLRQ